MLDLGDNVKVQNAKSRLRKSYFIPFQTILQQAL